MTVKSITIHLSAFPQADSDHNVWVLVRKRQMSTGGQLRANTMTSTKPEVRDVWNYHQRRTEPQTWATCTEISVKFGRVVLEQGKQTETSVKHANHNIFQVNVVPRWHCVMSCH